MEKRILFFALMGILPALGYADISDSGSLNLNGQAIVGGTMTVSGNAFSIGNSTLVVSAGKVGIGTTTPTIPLQVNRQSNGNIATFFSPGGGAYLQGKSNGFAMYGYLGNLGTSGNLYLGTGGSDFFTISNLGAFNIVGNTTFQSTVTVSSNNNGESTTLLSNSSNGTAAEVDLVLSNTGTAGGMMGLGVTGTDFTTTGGYVQDGGYLAAGTLLSGGLSIMTRAAVPIRFYTNGHTNFRGQINEDGGWQIGSGGTPFTIYSTGTWSPTLGGFSSYNCSIANYERHGRWVTVNFQCSGTSSSGGFTITLPFSSNQTNQLAACYVKDNGIDRSAAGSVWTRASSTTADLYTDVGATTGWTNSGTKTAYCTLKYESTGS